MRTLVCERISEHWFVYVVPEYREPLQKAGKDFTIVKILQSGVYQYRIILDKDWNYPHEVLSKVNNVLDVQVSSYSNKTILDTSAKDLLMTSGFPFLRRDSAKNERIERRKEKTSYQGFV